MNSENGNEDFDIWFYYNHDLMKTNKKQAIYNCYLRYNSKGLKSENIRLKAEIAKRDELIREAMSLGLNHRYGYCAYEINWKNDCNCGSYSWSIKAKEVLG